MDLKGAKSIRAHGAANKVTPWGRCPGDLNPVQEERDV